MKPVSVALFVVALLVAVPATAQLRICEWNVTNYDNPLPSPRRPAFQTAIYGIFQGRTLAPDVIVAQEILNSASANDFLAMLNDPNLAASPKDWAVAQFIDGPDTDSALFYRTGKVDLLQVTTVAVGGPSPNHPRNIQRYAIRPEGYSSNNTVLAIYSSHMKAQESGSDDEARRLLEAQRIRTNAENLDPNWHFMLGADLNIYLSSEAAYQELVGNKPNNAGRFFDPIATPGDWNNNCAFRFVHTQDPAGPGGMDDRFDQLLMENSLVDGVGFDYIGNPSIPYSTSTWNDLNHSYRAWGNDGSSCNGSLNTISNAMVGPAIAAALVQAAEGQGHLPVYVDMRVPAKIDVPQTLISFGTVEVGELAQQSLTVTNSGNVALWTTGGIAALNYTLQATAGFTVPNGSFSEAPGGGSGVHQVTMDTSTPGGKLGTLTINSDAPENPVITVTLIGNVVDPTVEGDVDGDGDVDDADLGLLLAAFGACSGDVGYNADADLDDSGCVNDSDLGVLLANYGG